MDVACQCKNGYRDLEIDVDCDQERNAQCPTQPDFECIIASLAGSLHWAGTQMTTQLTSLVCRPAMEPLNRECNRDEN